MKRRDVIILLSLGFLFVLAALYGLLSKEVIIKDEEYILEIVCFGGTVEGLLRKQEIVLAEGDQVVPGPEAPLQDGLEITIKRAMPLSVTVDGGVRALRTTACTVGEALRAAGLEIACEDKVEPSAESPVERDMDIKVVRVTHEFLTLEKEIPFDTIVQQDDKMNKGTEKILEKGTKGMLKEEIMISYHDGEEVRRESIKEEMLEAPVNRVVSRGTIDFIETSRGQVRFKKALNMSATAYDVTFESTGKNPDHPQYGITRSGTKVRPGVVAVDPKVIPLGTKLYVKSLDGNADYGFASAEDTGGAIKGNKIDLYFESPEDVKKYGRKNVLVYVLE